MATTENHQSDTTGEFELVATMVDKSTTMTLIRSRFIQPCLKVTATKPLREGVPDVLISDQAKEQTMGQMVEVEAVRHDAPARISWPCDRLSEEH